MNASNVPESPPSESTLQSIRSLLQSDINQIVGNFAGQAIRSHFQPIFSIAHSRTVGFEGLMRPSNATGSPVSPLDAFRMGQDFSHILTVDRLASAAHVHNFLHLKADGWLFLNMNSEVSLESAVDSNFFGEMLDAIGMPRHRVVIEILEQGVLDELRLIEAVPFFHKQGFLIALDSFGAGHSNFDRVWKVNSEQNLTAQP